MRRPLVNMPNMKVTVNKLNRRSSPVSNVGDKSNIIDFVSRGFSFNSTSQINNAAGTWYTDSAGNYYWAGGLTAADNNPVPVALPHANKLMPDGACINFIKQREGFKLYAYTDSAGIWTIGYGSILYQDGTPVKQNDTITEEMAEQFLQREVLAKSAKVNVMLGEANINQQQYDALVSFAYNVGTGALISSSLLKKVKANPSDKSIAASFLVWDKAHVDGELKEIPGLRQRRQDEANLYFS